MLFNPVSNILNIEFLHFLFNNLPDIVDSASIMTHLDKEILILLSKIYFINFYNVKIYLKFNCKNQSFVSLSIRIMIKAEITNNLLNNVLVSYELQRVNLYGY